MYKLCFFVPETYLESVKAALFDAGAGKIGAYDQCCWQVKGEGQFRPLKESQPFIGRMNKLERVAEYKVEMVCAKAHIKLAVTTLLKVHPYETPAYDIFQIIDENNICE